jgi:Na+-driven multidrug efflux pump
MPTLGVQMILAGALRGAGDTRTPMWVTFVGVLIFRLSLVYFLAIYLDLGLAGVWWGTAVDWAGRAALLWLVFRRGKWREIDLT